MLIDSKTFTALSKSLIAVRQNTAAIRKTLLNNRKTTKKLQSDRQRQEKLLEDQKRKNEQEQNIESKKQRTSSINTGKFFGNPAKAFETPGVGGIFSRIVAFFGFTLLGWMLNALPTIVKAVQRFVVKAKQFMKNLDSFFGGLKGFTSNIFDAVSKIFAKVTSNTSLGEGEETKVRNMISGMIDSIMKFIKGLPERIGSMVMGLVGMHNDAQEKIKKGVKEDEALESAVKEYVKLSGAGSPTEPETSRAAAIPVQPLVGSRGFIQGGSGYGREGEYATHFHLSPPTNDASGYEKARAVAFKAVRLMLARGSTVYFGNTKEYATSSLSDPKLRAMIKREQVAHTKPNRTQGGIDIQEQEPGKPLTIPGQPGTASVFPLTTGEIITDTSSSGGRMAKIIGSGGVLIAHGAAGSTASDGSTSARISALDLERERRASELAARSPRRRITIDREVPIDVSGIKSRNKEKLSAMSAATEIKIEVVSIDGNAISGGMFD